MQDVIKREIIINASQEKIYAAITDPELVVKWFPNKVEGSYAVGERPIFNFGENGSNQLYVEDAKPHSYFSYRWVPGANHFLGDVLSVPHTLVEFKIEPMAAKQCKVVLTESGFAELPAEMAEACFNQNSGGWEFMLGRLEHYFIEA